MLQKDVNAGVVRRDAAAAVVVIAVLNPVLNFFKLGYFSYLLEEKILCCCFAFCF